MKHFIFLSLLAMWSLFGCGKKAAASQQADAWLNQHFPKKFDILNSEYANNVWTTLDRSNFKLMLADKNDPELQFETPWNSTTPNGGTSAEAVQKAYQKAQEELHISRELLALFKQNGADKITVGVCEANVGYLVEIMFYGDFRPEQREKDLELVYNTFNKWPLNKQAHLTVELMEANYFGQYYNEILPKPAIHVSQNNKLNNCLFQVQTDWDPAPTLPQLIALLTVNTDSDRTSNIYLQDALHQGGDWAAKHVKQPVFLRINNTMVEPDEKDPLAVKFYIPYFNTKEAADAEPKYDDQVAGYICGTYFVDKQVFTNISSKKEL